MQGRIADLNVSIFNSKQRLTLELDGDFRLQYDELKDKPLEITIKPYRKKRSLDSNSYCWVLLGKIADKLRAGKDEVYLTMLKRYGQGGVIKVQPQNEQAILSALKYYEPHEKLYTERLCNVAAEIHVSVSLRAAYSVIDVRGVKLTAAHI